MAGSPSAAPSKALKTWPLTTSGVVSDSPLRSVDLPGGVTCLLKLRSLGIKHRPMDGFTHINTAVRLEGPIGGVLYRATGKRPFDSDCRLLLALWRAAPLFRSMGIAELRYSNVYRKSAARAAHRSRHTLGLAIDIHRVTVCSGGTCRELTLSRDFQRGLSFEGDGPKACRQGNRPLLNRLACWLSRGGYFDRVLTPDTNAAHRNHFHWAILSFERRRFSPSRRKARPVVVD